MSTIYSSNKAININSNNENDSSLDKRSICKYMSLNSFLGIIRHKKLRLSNISTYDDTYEGIPLYNEVKNGFSISKIAKGVK